MGLGLVVLWLVAPSAAPTTVLELPPVGTVRPALLADGTPVFVAHDRPGEVRVVEALAPETVSVSGIGELVAWCEEGRRFVAGHHGRTFAPNGDRYVGSTPGRLPVDDPPVPQNLVVREWEVVDGSVGAGDPLRVGAPLDPGDPPSELRRPQLDAAQSSLGPPASCQLPLPPLLTPVPGSDTPIGGRPPVDHGSVAGPLDPDVDGWQIVRTDLLVTADGGAALCDLEPAGSPRTCPTPVAVPVALGLDADDTGDGWAVLSGPLALRLRNGTVVGVAAMFSTVWRGSSLRGGVAYTADLEAVSVSRSVAELRTVTDDPPCVGPGRAQPGEVLPPPGVQYVDEDTEVDLLGLTDASQVETILSEDRSVAPVRVDVVADSGTCRALRIVEAP